MMGKAISIRISTQYSTIPVFLFVLFFLFLVAALNKNRASRKMLRSTMPCEVWVNHLILLVLKYSFLPFFI
jgi:hypothetical protein